MTAIIKMCLAHHFPLQDRARVQGRRRPPSRQARKAAAATSPDVTDGNDDSAPSTPNGHLSPPDDLHQSQPALPVTADHASRSHSSYQSAAHTIPVSVDNRKSAMDQSEEENLFSAVKKKADISGAAISRSRTSSKNDEDLSSSVDAKRGDKIGTQPRTDQRTEEADDIFSSLSTNKSSKPTSSRSDEVFIPSKISKSAVGSDSLGNVSVRPKAPPTVDEDDIFASSKLSIKKEAPPPARQQAADDIFSGVKVPVKSRPVVEEDDIFADSSLAKKKGEAVFTTALCFCHIFKVVTTHCYRSSQWKV